MNSLSFLRLATCIACIVANHHLSAVVESTTGIEKPNKRTCRIVFTERHKDAPKFAYLFDGKESRRIRLPSTNFSEVIELCTGELSITMTPTEINDSKNLPLDAPKLTLRESVQDFYILVSSDPANSTLPLKMRIVDLADKKLKPGYTLWINQTDLRISAKLGEKEMSVAPGGETISKDPISISGYYKAKFHYQTNSEGKPLKITEQQWWHDTDSRHLGFIVNTGGRLPKIYFYRDFRQ